MQQMLRVLNIQSIYQSIYLSIYLFVSVCFYSKLFIIFTQPLRSGRIWHKVNFYAEFNRFEFRVFLLLEAEEPSLPYYLPIAGGRIIGFIPFPRILVLCEMQSVSSRIWTRVAVFISYDNIHYTTGTSQILNCLYISKYPRLFLLLSLSLSHTHTHTHTYTHIYIYIFVCMCVCVCVCSWLVGWYVDTWWVI